MAGCSLQGNGLSGLFPSKMHRISGHCLLLKKDLELAFTRCTYPACKTWPY